MDFVDKFLGERIHALWEKAMFSTSAQAVENIGVFR